MVYRGIYSGDLEFLDRVFLMDVQSEYDNTKHLTQAYEYMPSRWEGGWLNNLTRLADLNALVEVM